VKKTVLYILAEVFIGITFSVNLLYEIYICINPPNTQTRKH